MLSFTAVNRIFLTGQLVLIGECALAHVSILIPFAWAMAYIAVLAWGSMTPSLGMFIHHRCHGEVGTLALTYDDGPHPKHTPALLDLLRSADVKATFFCIGRQVDAHPAIARRIVEEGHAIGIHTQDHRWNWGFLNKQQATQQIKHCAQAIQAATGQTPVLFRPPFGVTSPGTAAAMAGQRVQPIGWDLRTFDTSSRSAQHVMRRIRRRLPAISIILLHDTLPSAMELTRSILAQCREHGIRLVKLTPDS